MKTKVLETTAERLVIQETAVSWDFLPLLLPVFCVNLAITACIVFVFAKEFLVQLLVIAIGWLLIHFLVPLSKEGFGVYCIAVILGCCPWLGIISLTYLAIRSHVISPLRVTLTFDKNDNLLTIQSKFLFFSFVTKYLLSNIIESKPNIIERTEHIGSGSYRCREVPTVQLAIRRQRDGKILKKDIEYLDQKVVGLIDRFLLNTSSVE
jgi:hypothetical protein